MPPIIRPPLAGIGLEADLREEGGRLVILVLGPALERVIVALVAVEPNGQEELGRVLHGGRRLAEDLEIGGRRVVLVRAGGRHDRSRTNWS